MISLISLEVRTSKSEGISIQTLACSKYTTSGKANPLIALFVESLYDRSKISLL